MKRIVLLLLAAVVAGASTVSAQGPTKEAVAKALAAIQGTWVIQSINGQSPADMGAEMSLTFTDAAYAQTVNGAVDERGTITIDPSKTPMTIDLTITEGNDAGKVQPGIFEIKDGVMTCKLTFPGETRRPTSLLPEEGFLLFVAKKAK